MRTLPTARALGHRADARCQARWPVDRGTGGRTGGFHKECDMSQQLTAGAACNRKVASAERGLSVAQAAQRMRDSHVGCLVVVDQSGAGPLAVGVLTDRDIVTAVVAKEIDPGAVSVGDVMSRELVTGSEQDSLLDVLRTMRRKGLRRLPITTPAGVLVGLLALDDVVAIMAEQMNTLARTIDTGQRRERQLRP
jgi:CBS domain-containing protein